METLLQVSVSALMGRTCCLIQWTTAVSYMRIFTVCLLKIIYYFSHDVFLGGFALLIYLNLMFNAVRVWDIRPFAPKERCVKIFQGNVHNFEKVSSSLYIFKNVCTL